MTAYAARTNDSSLLRLRRRLVPDELQLGWMPIFGLGYLVFLFLPGFFGYGGPRDMRLPALNVWLTVASVPLFLPLYFAAYRARGIAALGCVLGIAALAYALLPFNVFANTYVIYAAAATVMMGGSLLRRAIWAALVLAGFLVEVVLLNYPMFVFAITAIIAVAVFVGNWLYFDNARKRAELKLSHDEVRRLAALAERERIGRDLHDLLGHTLSMVALKSELAGKLLERDPDAARREIDDVSRVARDALSQVRSAVSGIRATGLAAELAAAKLLLECDGVGFRYTQADIALTPQHESALALTLREAVTNIQRHARAQHAEVMFDLEVDDVVLRISDDGRGGSLVPGNGLAGMRERIEALGGRLRIDAGSGRGTRIEARLPLLAAGTVSLS